MSDVLNKIVKFRRVDKYEDLDGEDGLSRIVPAAAMPPSVADSGSVFHRRGTDARDSEKVTSTSSVLPEGCRFLCLLLLTEIPFLLNRRMSCWADKTKN